MKKKIGLFVMVYGMLYKEEDIECYYIYICRGRKLSFEMLEDLIECYCVIGGIFFLVIIILE